jgi:hypothetical protein
MLFQLKCTNSTTSTLQFVLTGEADEYTLVSHININNGIVHVKYDSYTQEQLSHRVIGEPGLYVASGELASQQWAVANLTCEEAQQNRSGYACVSMNSMCLGVNSARGYVGYRCKCIFGFDGNPYITDGCQGTLCLILIISCAPSNMHSSLHYGDAIINGCSCIFLKGDFYHSPKLI